MKYWWLKRYKDIKIKLIPELTRQVNDNFVMPKNYKERYLVIKENDIEKLNEEDLVIYLYCILNHEKIKNNKIILIINELLKIPDNSMPATNYTLLEMLEDVKKLKTLKPVEDKMYTNNICSCYNCFNVFYVDEIKYVNKKGYLICPYCKNTTMYFDNDFMPMDYNFLHLAKLYYKNTMLGCNFTNLKRLIKKSINVKKDDINNYKTGAIFVLGEVDEDKIELNNNNMTFILKEIKMKKEITTKEEKKIEFIFNRYLDIIEKNLIREVTIDTRILVSDKKYATNISLLLTLISNLGKNPYLKKINLITNDENNYYIYKEMYKILINFK